MTTLTLDTLIDVLPNMLADGIAEAIREQQLKPVSSSHASSPYSTGTVVSTDTTSALVQLDEDDPGVYATLQLGTSVVVGARVTALMQPNGSGTIVGSNTAAAGGGVGSTVGALIGSTANATTALTTINATTGALLALRANPGSAITSGSLLGQYGFGGTYDGTNFNDNMAGIAGFSHQPFTAAHGGAYLSAFTTPDDTVTPLEVQRWTAAGDARLTNLGTLDSIGWLTGGQWKGQTSVMVNPTLAGTGLGVRSTVTDAVLVQDQYTVQSATIAFTPRDVGKYISVVAGTGTITAGTPGQFNVHSAYIVTFDSATQVTTSQPSPVSGTGFHLSIQDTAPGTPNNTVWNYTFTDPGGGTFAPDVQSGYSFAANQGPRGVWGLEGTFTIANMSGSRPAFNPITMQTFMTRKNARGVTAAIGAGAAGFNLSDQLIADGATLTVSTLLGFGAYRGIVNNHVFSTLNGGYLDMASIEFREFQTQSGMNTGTHLRTRVGFLVNQFGGDILASTSTTGTSTSIAAGPPGTLTDSTASWTTNQWAGKTVWAQNATKHGVVASNTSTVLTLTGAWVGGTPTTGAYVVGALLDHNYGIFIRQQTPPNGFTSYPAVGISTQSPIEFMPTGSWLSDAASDLVMPFTTVMSGAANGLIYTDPANTYTFDFASARVGSLIAVNSTFAMLQTANSFSMFSGYTLGATFTNDPAHTANLGPSTLFLAAGKYQADTKTITSPANIDLFSNPNYQTINSGTLTATSHAALVSWMTIGSGATLTTRYGVQINDASGAGALGTNIGIDIAAFSKGTTKIGIRNASPLIQSGDATFTGAVDLTGATVTGVGGGTSLLANLTKTNPTTQVYAVSDITAYAITSAALTTSNFNATVDSNISATATGLGTFSGGSGGPLYGMLVRRALTGNLAYNNVFGVRVQNTTRTANSAAPYTQSVTVTTSTGNATILGNFDATFIGSAIGGGGTNIAAGSIVLSVVAGVSATMDHVGLANGTFSVPFTASTYIPSPLTGWTGTSHTPAVVNQYGYYCDALSGATNNYAAWLAGSFFDGAGNLTVNGAASVSGAFTPGSIGLAASPLDFIGTSLAAATILRLTRDELAVTATGTNLGILSVRGVSVFTGGVSTYTNAGQIAFRTDESSGWTATAHGGAIDLYTSPSNAGQAIAMTLDKSQNVQIPNGTLKVSGNIGFNGKATQATTGWAAPTATALRTAAPNATYSTTGGTGATAGAFDTAAHRDNVISDLVSTMQRLGALITDLRANGVVG